MVPPEPPEIPKSRSFDDDWRNNSIRTSLAQAQLASLDLLHRGDEFTPTAKVIETIEETFEIHVRISKMKHGHTTMLGTFLAVFGSWEDATSLSIPFVISTSELPEKVEGQLPVIVRRESQVRHVI